jgi:nicotinamidase-related amidase
LVSGDLTVGNDENGKGGELMRSDRRACIMARSSLRAGACFSKPIFTKTATNSDIMSDDFENHCWKDVVSSDVLNIYSHYKRHTFVGPSPALIAIDLYELVYLGGAKPVAELHNIHPSSCGEYAYAAIVPTQRLFAAARGAGIPIFYTTQDTRPNGAPLHVSPTKRRNAPSDPTLFLIKSEFNPQPDDVIVPKQRASGFYGTPLLAHLICQDIQTVIICGESTSGCVRATAVDAYSNGFHVVVVEECCFDRSLLSHKINLFDLHHKYADVLHIEEVVRHLNDLARQKL